MDYLKVLVEEIHSVVVATVDETGHPHTAVMDMMWEDGKTVYFLTADFKSLYKRLKEDGRVAVTGMTQGAGTMDRKSISLTGQVEWIGKEHLEELLKANPSAQTILLFLSSTFFAHFHREHSPAMTELS